MSDMYNPQYLLKEQYSTSNNLNARIQLHERFSTNPADWHRWVFEQFVFEPGSHILELGCGSGLLWQKNLERIPDNCTITLSDFSAGMLQDAQQNLAASRQAFSFQVIDAQAIPLADSSFNYVIANYMLYHVPDRARAFAEIRRILRPRGCFFAATTGEKHMYEVKELCKRAGLEGSGVFSTPQTSVFSLENGPAQIAPWFPNLELRHQPNGLVVTEAEPLVAFILSGLNAEKVSDEKIQTLQTLIEQELAEHGAVRITKDTGLFVAYGE